MFSQIERCSDGLGQSQDPWLHFHDGGNVAQVGRSRYRLPEAHPLRNPSKWKSSRTCRFQDRQRIWVFPYFILFLLYRSQVVFIVNNVSCASCRYARYLSVLNIPDALKNMIDDYQDAADKGRSLQDKECKDVFDSCDFSVKETFLKKLKSHSE